MTAVLCVGDDANQGLLAALTVLLHRFALQVQLLAVDAHIPGSFWGEREAGLRGNFLYVRGDTPLHSALHEACHFICMDAPRRLQLDRDAKSDDAEENAVCYLQILLADELPNCNRARMQQDMDAWGYTFRLGSAQAWFESDAADARAWLQREDIIDQHTQLTWRVRR
jgi:hypothetical protein